MKKSKLNTQPLKVASTVVRDLFGMPVSEIYAEYARFLERARKPSASAARYVWHVLEPHFGHRGIGEVDANVCLDYAAARRAAGVADATVWGELSRLHASLSHAHRNGKIPILPPFWKPAPPRRRERWLTRDEARRLIEAADKAQHIRLFIILAIATAARESALLQLTWDRVDFASGTIDLDDPGRPPTAKRRAMVAMNATARAALEQAKAQARSRFVVEYGGRPVRCIWAGVKAAAERAGLAGVSPHVLRHSSGTWQAMAGVSLLDIATMMGVDITTAARVYLKRTQGHLVDAAAAVNIDIGGTYAPNA